MTRSKPVQSTSLATAIALVLAGIGVPQEAAEAQEAAAQGELQEILVVGSRIKRQDEVAVSPIQTLSEEDLRLNGSLSLGDTLQTLPTVGPSLNLNGSAGTAHGTSSINLRNLGENRTLSADGGRFRDEFGAYAVHLYRIGD